MAPNIIMAVPIPYLNAIVAGIWGIVTSVIMVKRVHRTTTLHALGACLWPLGLAICIGIGFAIIIGVGAAMN